MNSNQLAQVVNELLEANEQALAVLAGAVGDVVGREELGQALARRIARSQEAINSPARDLLLSTAVQALLAKQA